MKNFLFKLKFVKFRDYLALLSFFVATPVAFVYKFIRKDLWLVCERANEARDNGYWFYHYMITKHPEQDCVYAIKKESPDYEKVSSLGREVIEFGSFKHWVYYLAASVNISSQKEGKPNAAVCYLLEIYGIRKNKRVYLKHGIVHNDLKWHYYNVTKMWLYICSSKKEYDYCKHTFGYSDANMALTGLCRFDNLNDELLSPKTIFIMPTSREWIAHPIQEYKKYDDIWHFEKTEYYRAWKHVLEDEEFNKCISDNKLNVIFYLHPTMQQFSDYFKILNTNVLIKDNSNADLQLMLKKAALLITDYSSIFFDFAYMRKPLLYYQFDYEKFREGHYQEGYFSYEKNGFGKVCYHSHELVNQIIAIVNNNMIIDSTYLNRINDFFAFNDKNNCERVYNAIKFKLNGGVEINE